MKTFLLAALALLAGCAALDRIWTGGPREISRLRDGAVEYRCEANRTLTLRFDADRSAWLLFQDREVRLDAGADGRWSNGRNTLIVRGDEVSLQEGTATTHAGCKRSAAA